MCCDKPPNTGGKCAVGFIQGGVESCPEETRHSVDDDSAVEESVWLSSSDKGLHANCSCGSHEEPMSVPFTGSRSGRDGSICLYWTCFFVLTVIKRDFHASQQPKTPFLRCAQRTRNGSV